jgi:transcriptional regulator with XRE-family HTH domain
MNIDSEIDSSKKTHPDFLEKDIGKAIAALRKSYLLSISAFSMRTGYSRVHISEVESGKRKATDEMVDSIRKVFHLDSDWPFPEDRHGASGGFGQHPKLSEQKVLSSIEATAERLLVLRKELNINQKDFSKLTGISVAIIEDVVYGRRKLTMRMAQRIEDACSIGTEWLLHGDEDAKYHPCGQRMTSFLKKHPKARKKVWEMMEREND